MGSKWSSLIRFGSFESAKYGMTLKVLFYLYFKFLAFFSWIRIRTFRIRNQEKMSGQDPEKNPDPEHCDYFTSIRHTGMWLDFYYI